MATNEMDAAIAATRFGLGARPGEIESALRDPRAFLTAQILRDGAEQPASNGESSEERMAEQIAMRQRRQEIRQEAASTTVDATTAATSAAKMQGARASVSDVRSDFISRLQLGTATANSFTERWVLFWANHFTVSIAKPLMSTLVGPFEQEAIRPHVFGRFADLLTATSRHPAMLLYLDQAASIGPTSQMAGSTPRLEGLNENLAREIMELHTLGVDGGYEQKDVTEFARALTGWSVGRIRDPQSDQGKFIFRAAAHEPGARTIRGKSYAPGGVEQGEAVLRDLATAPATARFVCTKIARHFVADTPPPALVDRLVNAWTGSGGQIGKVAEALIAAPESWDPTPRKFKTPYEFLVSAHRAVGIVPKDGLALMVVANKLGQRPFGPQSPKGWPESEQVWAAPGSLVARMEWAERFAASTVGEPMMVARQALGPRLTQPVATAISRAETRQEAIAVLLMSPEFQRR